MMGAKMRLVGAIVAEAIQPATRCTHGCRYCRVSGKHDHAACIISTEGRRPEHVR